MRLRSARVWLAAPSAALLLIAASGASASTLDVGGGSVHDCTFPCVDRLQQVYAASLFPGPVLIDAVGFFVAPANTHAWNGTSTWQMTISTSAYPVSGLDVTFANNVGPDVVLFDTRTFSGTPAPGSVVAFDGPGSFAYDPGNGDLLIDIVRTAGVAFGVGFQGDWNNPVVMNRALAWNSTTTADFAQTDGYGLRTRFVLVPEPSTGVLLALGLVGLRGCFRGRRA